MIDSLVIIQSLNEVVDEALFWWLTGDYEVSIKFNDEHIPDSPFIVPIATLSDDARRLTVTSLQVCFSFSFPLSHTRLMNCTRVINLSEIIWGLELGLGMVGKTNFKVGIWQPVPSSSLITETTKRNKKYRLYLSLYCNWDVVLTNKPMCACDLEISPIQKMVVFLISTAIKY